MEEATVASVHPIFGVEIIGVDVVPHLSSESQDSTEHRNLAQKLKELVHKHKLVILRGQPVLTGAQQIQLSRWFGSIEEAGFEQHVKSPDRTILRVSNDEDEGFRDFGTSGFHIDGSFMEKPNAFSIYHIIHTPQAGTTAFVDFNGVLSSLSVLEQHEWQRLWLVKSFKRIRGYRDEPGYVIHPLVYPHPLTGLKTLCIHQGKTSRFLRDWGVNIAKKLSKYETTQVLDKIEVSLAKDDNKFQYHHKWENGDVIISDNLAVGHKALADTQLSRDQVGLRVMHRTVIQGSSRPWVDARDCLLKYTQVTEDSDLDMDDVDSEDIDMIQDYSTGDMDKMHRLVRSLGTATS